MAFSVLAVLSAAVTARPVRAEDAEQDLVARCGPSAKGFARVVFDTSDGATIIGAKLGTGPIGIVLTLESDGTLCNALPYAKLVAAKNRTIIAIDMRTYGESKRNGAPFDRYDLDVAAAVTYLRGAGATRIVLMGASLGGTAVIAASTAIKPRVDAVISLSGCGHDHACPAAVGLCGDCCRERDVDSGRSGCGGRHGWVAY